MSMIRNNPDKLRRQESRNPKRKLAAAVTAVSLLAACSSEGAPREATPSTGVKVTVDVGTTNPSAHETGVKESNRQKLRQEQLRAAEAEMLDRGEKFEAVFERAQGHSSQDLVDRGLSQYIIRFHGSEQHVLKFAGTGAELVTVSYPDYEHRSDQGETPLRLQSVELRDQSENKRTGISFSPYSTYGDADATAYVDRPIFTNTGSSITGPDAGEVADVLDSQEVESTSNIDFANGLAAFDRANAESGQVFIDNLELLKAMLDTPVA